MSSNQVSPGASDRQRLRLPLHWLGVLPFAAFTILFLIMPTMKIVIGAFQTPDGSFTFENIGSLFTTHFIKATGLHGIDCKSGI